MSNALGQVRFKDGLILYFEYQGVSDTCMSNLRDSVLDIRTNWRKHDWLECTCGKDEPVEMASAYGFGFWSREGRACRHCRAITKDAFYSGNDEDEDASIDGYPSWWIGERYERPNKT